MNSVTIEISMYVPEEASTGPYEVVKVSECLFKLMHNDPFNPLLSYGTIIEVLPEKKDGGVFIFKGVHTESSYNLEVIALPGVLSESELRVVGQMIIEEGGYWEVIFGGMGYVNLPKSSKLDVTDELSKLVIGKQKQ